MMFQIQKRNTFTSTICFLISFKNTIHSTRRSIHFKRKCFIYLYFLFITMAYHYLFQIKYFLQSNRTCATKLSNAFRELLTQFAYPSQLYTAMMMKT